LELVLVDARMVPLCFCEEIQSLETGIDGMTAAQKQFATALFGLVFSALSAFAADAGKSQLVSREIYSKNFSQNKIGVSSVRKLVVYLPAGYDASDRHFPVIYYLPNTSESYRFVFDHEDAQRLFDRAIESGVIRKFIFVSVDMTTPLESSWYVNSPVTGNWEDFFMAELVPYIDANFKTLRDRNSRGIAGDRLGAYGAFLYAMRRPDVLGSVYAMHPVGTGSGLVLSLSKPRWELLANAKALDDVREDTVSRIFTTIFQAHLPDINKPPLFIDLPAQKVGDRFVIDVPLMERLRNNFYLETIIPKYAENLRSLRGIKFDWGRSDTNQDHVYANQAFTHKLIEYGVAHDAEEYNGTWGEANWGDDGRIVTEVLPFFQRTLLSDQTTH
jgi:hypothetical protein